MSSNGYNSYADRSGYYGQRTYQSEVPRRTTKNSNKVLWVIVLLVTFMCVGVVFVSAGFFGHVASVKKAMDLKKKAETTRQMICKRGLKENGIPLSRALPKDLNLYMHRQYMNINIKSRRMEGYDKMYFSFTSAMNYLVFNAKNIQISEYEIESEGTKIPTSDILYCDEHNLVYVLPEATLLSGNVSLLIKYTIDISKGNRGLHLFKERGFGDASYVTTDINAYEAMEIFPCFSLSKHLAKYILAVEHDKETKPVFVTPMAKMYTSDSSPSRMITEFHETIDLQVQLWKLSVVNLNSSYGAPAHVGNRKRYPTHGNGMTGENGDETPEKHLLGEDGAGQQKTGTDKPHLLGEDGAGLRRKLTSISPEEWINANYIPPPSRRIHIEMSTLKHSAMDNDLQEEHNKTKESKLKEQERHFIDNKPEDEDEFSYNANDSE